MSVGAWNQKIDKHFKEFDDISEGHISTHHIAMRNKKALKI